MGRVIPIQPESSSNLGEPSAQSELSKIDENGDYQRQQQKKSRSKDEAIVYCRVKKIWKTIYENAEHELVAFKNLKYQQDWL